MFKKRNVDMFGDEQEYFENRQAEPMNEAFFEEHFDSSASVYGVNDDLSDKKKEAKQLRRDKKKLTLRNYLYPLTSMAYYVTLVIVETIVFIAAIELERNIITTPIKYTGESLLLIAAVVAVILYIVFIFLSIPLLRFRDETKSKVKELMGLDATPINAGNAQPANSSQNTDIKKLIRRNIGWIIPVGIVVMIASGGSALIILLVVLSIFRKHGKFYTDKYDNKKK